MFQFVRLPHCWKPTYLQMPRGALARGSHLRALRTVLEGNRAPHLSRAGRPREG
jgi:hypothetical protein